MITAFEMPRSSDIIAPDMNVKIRYTIEMGPLLHVDIQPAELMVTAKARNYPKSLWILSTS